MNVCPHNKFERFRFFVLPDNRSGTQNIDIPANEARPLQLAQLTIHSDPGDIVKLRATIGWVATEGLPVVIFTIWRDEPVTGTFVARARETGEQANDRFEITDFSHDDTFFPEERNYTYYLTAHLEDNDTGASVIGPVTFTAVEIDACSG